MATSKPITREEKYLAKTAGQETNIPTPITRKEKYLAKMAGSDVNVPTPITREEKYLNEIAEHGGGGGGGQTVTVINSNLRDLFVDAGMTTADCQNMMSSIDSLNVHYTISIMLGMQMGVAYVKQRVTPLIYANTMTMRTADISRGDDDQLKLTLAAEASFDCQSPNDYPRPYRFALADESGVMDYLPYAPFVQAEMTIIHHE